MILIGRPCHCQVSIISISPCPPTWSSGGFLLLFVFFILFATLVSGSFCGLCVCLLHPCLHNKRHVTWSRDEHNVLNKASEREILKDKCQQKFTRKNRSVSLLTGFFFPPNMSLKKIVKKTTTTETRIPIVRFGCFSPFSMRSCPESKGFTSYSNERNITGSIVPKERKKRHLFNLVTHIYFGLVITQEGNVCDLV